MERIREREVFFGVNRFYEETEDMPVPKKPRTPLQIELMEVIEHYREKGCSDSDIRTSFKEVFESIK